MQMILEFLGQTMQVIHNQYFFKKMIYHILHLLWLGRTFCLLLSKTSSNKDVYNNIQCFLFYFQSPNEPLIGPPSCGLRVTKAIFSYSQLLCSHLLRLMSFIKRFLQPLNGSDLHVEYYGLEKHECITKAQMELKEIKASNPYKRYRKALKIYHRSFKLTHKKNRRRMMQRSICKYKNFGRRQQSNDNHLTTSSG